MSWVGGSVVVVSDDEMDFEGIGKADSCAVTRPLAVASDITKKRLIAEVFTSDSSTVSYRVGTVAEVYASLGMLKLIDAIDTALRPDPDCVWRPNFVRSVADSTR
jgi:hypothetical protein